MKRSWTISLFQIEQPSKPAWLALVDLVHQWNEVHSQKFAPVMDFMWHVNFEEETQEEMRRLIESLDQLANRYKATYRVASRTTIEEEDYERADYIEILGEEITAVSDSFLLNVDTALVPAEPCSSCGHQDAFDMVQTEPFEIDSTVLTDVQRSWDLLGLPGGHKLISHRLRSVLRENALVGYQLNDVIDANSTQTSNEYFQILADSSILVPCEAHTQIDGEPFCPSCGTAYGALEGYYWIRDKWVGDRDVISRHPNRGAMLYVSRHVYKQLQSAHLNGIHRHHVLFVCNHTS